MDSSLTGDSSLLYTVVYLPNYAKAPAFRGFAQSVSSVNVEGNFDILPLHENFVTIIREKLVIVDKEGGKYQLVFGRGLVETAGNLVKIFVEF